MIFTLINASIFQEQSLPWMLPGKSFSVAYFKWLLERHWTYWLYILTLMISFSRIVAKLDGSRRSKSTSILDSIRNTCVFKKRPLSYVRGGEGVMICYYIVTTPHRSSPHHLKGLTERTEGYVNEPGNGWRHVMLQLIFDSI